MSAPEIVTHHRGGHRRPQPRRLAAPFDLLPHHKGHRSAHRATAEHFSEAALRMGHTQHEDEEDSGASEADLLCSEVLSESLDDGSDVGSDEMYARRYYRIPQVWRQSCCFASVPAPLQLFCLWSPLFLPFMLPFQLHFHLPF